MPVNRFLEKAEVEIYANTLLDQMNETGGIDAVMEVRSQLEEVVAYNRSHIDLTSIASDLGYTPEQRSRVVRAAFADANPALADVLGVMVERGSLDMLPRVLSVYNDLIRTKLGVTVVDVVTRVSLDDHLRDIIKKKANAELGGEVVLRERIDQNMLGGIIMSAGGQRIDASMNTLLENARVALKKS